MSPRSQCWWWHPASTSPRERPQTATALQPARHTAPSPNSDAALEVLLAVCIEEPKHKQYGSSSLDELGLSYWRAGDPAIWFRGPFLALLTAVVAVWVMPALAQSPLPPLPFPPLPMPQGTPEERAACAPDVHKFCGSDLQDTMRVLACLQANRPKISAGCNRVLVSHGQ
jgi:hypothetical protein